MISKNLVRSIDIYTALYTYCMYFGVPAARFLRRLVKRRQDKVYKDDMRTYIIYIYIYMHTVSNVYTAVYSVYNNIILSPYENISQSGR